MRWLPLLLPLLAPSLASAWQPNGVRLTGAQREQTRPLLASDGAGGAYVAWLDYRASGAPLDLGIGLYLQHVTGTGQIAPGWPADGLAVAAGPGHQGAEALIPDGSGGVLVVFQDTGADEGDVYLRRITAAGTIAPDWLAGGIPVATGPGRQNDAQLAGDGAGGAFVAWADFHSGVR